MLSPIPLPLSLVVKKGMNICSGNFRRDSRAIVFISIVFFRVVAMSLYRNASAGLIADCLHCVFQKIDNDL